jgi:hypothetical protein
MKLTKVMVGAMAAASALAVFPAHAVQLVGGSWEPFYWENPNYPDPYGGPIYDYFSGDPFYTFTVTTHDALKITDAFYNLDTFDLTINNVDEGSTGTPADTDYAYIDPFDPLDPNNTIYPASWDTAYASSYFSHAIYELGPGSYTVTGLVPYSPSGAGAGVGALELVPEPAGWALMLLGFGMIGGLMRRRAVRAAVA